MARQHFHQDPHDRGDVEVEERTVRRAPEDETYEEREIRGVPWSPAQGIALALGIALVALGGIVLARSGFDDIFDHVNVLGLHHTPLLGLVEILFGVMFLAAGATPIAGRGLMAFAGGLMLAFGIIVGAQPSTFHEALGAHSAHGWLMAIIGVVALLAALAAPVIRGSGRSYRHL